MITRSIKWIQQLYFLSVLLSHIHVLSHAYLISTIIACFVSSHANHRAADQQHSFSFMRLDAMTALLLCDKGVIWLLHPSCTRQYHMTWFKILLEKWWLYTLHKVETVTLYSVIKMNYFWHIAKDTRKCSYDCSANIYLLTAIYATCVWT